MTRGRRKSRDILGRFSALSMAAVVLLSAFSTVMSSAISASAASSTADAGTAFYIHKPADTDVYNDTVRVNYLDSTGAVLDYDDISGTTTTAFGSENAWYTGTGSTVQAYDDENGVAKVAINSGVTGVTSLRIENISDAATANAVQDLYDNVSGNRVLVLYDNSLSGWTQPYYYVWRGSTNNRAFPGQTMTRVGSSALWYATVDRSTYDNIIFSNGSTSNQTADLSLPAAGATSNNTYDSATNSWSTYSGADYSVTVSLSSRKNNHFNQTQTSNDIYLTGRSRAQWSEYSSEYTIQSSDMSTIYFRPSSAWSNAYVHFDGDDPYSRVMQMSAYGTDTGIFQATVPTDMTLGFSTDGASSTNVNVQWSSNINTYNTYIQSDRQWNTLNYALSQTTTKADLNVTNLNINSNTTGNDISWMNATYFDYYANQELSGGWRQGITPYTTGSGDNHGYRVQFTEFNKYIMEYADNNTAWRYPLVFGDLYTTTYIDNQSGGNSYWGNYLNNNNNGATFSVFQKVNNSNYMDNYSASGVDRYNQAIMGIVDTSLTNNNITANDVAMPYFDYDLLNPGSSDTQTAVITTVSSGNYIRVTIPKSEFSGNTIAKVAYSSSGENTLDTITNGGYILQPGGYYAHDDSISPYGRSSSDTNNYYVVINKFHTNGTLWGNVSLEISDGDKSTPTNGILVSGDSKSYDATTFQLTSATASSSYAKVISSSFPFRTYTDTNDVTFYEYDSERDHTWFSMNGNAYDGSYTSSTNENSLQLNYSNASRDAVNNALADTSGLFPFNTPTNTTANSYPQESGHNFGFGIRMDIDFTLPENGKYSNGTSAEFNFTGDDDLWVFIDGELVLDLGGNHRKTSGSIDFGYAAGQIQSTSNHVDYIVNRVPTYTYYEYILDSSVDNFVVNNGSSNYQYPSGDYRMTKSQLNGRAFFTNDNSIAVAASGYNSYTDSEGKFHLFVIDNGSKGASYLYAGLGSANTIGSWPGYNSNNSNPSNLVTANTGNYTTTSTVGDNNVSGAQTQTFAFDNTDPNQKHTMTIFYMERGANDSNMSMEFSVQPVENDLNLNKEVDVPELNSSGLQANVEAAVAAEDFDFTITENNSNYATTTLSNGESALYSENLDFGDQITVSEAVSENNIFEYDTDLVVLYPDDTEAPVTKSNSNRDGSFTFANKENDESSRTSMFVTYTNTLKTGSFSLEKLMQNENGESTTSISYPFTFTVEYSLDGGNSFVSGEGLQYTLNDGERLYPVQSSGRMTLARGQVAHFTGLPQGAIVRIAEASTAGYVFVESQVGSATATNNRTVEFTIGDGETAVTYTNRYNPGSGQLAVDKTLDGADYTPIENASTTPVTYKEENFTFTANLIDVVDTQLSQEQITALMDEYQLEADQDDFNTTTGRYHFPNVTISTDQDHDGHYIFEIKESALTGESASKFNTDNTTYYADLIVTAGSTEFTINYYRSYNAETHEVSNPVNSSVPSTPPTFANETAIKYTDVIFTKTASDTNQGLGGVEFTLYTNEACTTEATRDSASNPDNTSFSATVTSHTNTGGSDTIPTGQVTFSQLKYDPSVTTEAAATYYFKETKTVSGYQLIPGTYKIEIENDGTYTISYSAASDGNYTTVTGNSVTNNKLPDLPLAGGSGVVPIVVTGVGLVLLSGAGYIIYRRRRVGAYK